MAAEVEGYASERSDEEISVGCPSPAPRSCSSEEEQHDDYFRPLKKLKMMQIDQVSYSIGKGKTKKIRPRRTSSPGLKGFSILDILNHRNKDKEDETLVSSTRIVRPWDEVPRVAPALLYRLPPHPELYETCSSGRSSASDCTSPDIINCTLPRQQQARKSPNSSPLDALFQMTSKTFEELNGEQSQENGGNGLMFSSRQQPKKKRKSRTAFTNHQIFELEKRFLYQKYLSPADRDEIAAQLGLTNAQVITWFQNRRAKLKRDMEELKKDVETAKAFTQHKNFLENVQNFSILKKKPAGSSEEDKPSSPISEK